MITLQRLKDKETFQIFTIYLRYLIGGAFIFSGLGKLIGERFIPAGSMQIPTEGMVIDVFFETLFRTGLWWRFIGFGQVLAGLLLVTQRWSTLGAILSLPISLNIFFITVSMDFRGTPIVTGLILLGNLWLLLWDYARLRILFYPNRNIETVVMAPSDQLGVPVIWESLGLVIFIISISFGNRENFLLWSALCLVSGLIGLIYYKMYVAKLKRN
ncbi:DoxX family membrane protein [Dyadobacter sp. CY345]|uniref:DoxX family membrane protein n=1 Tax=Dyadobacter sp. CY345 TaxID=2909335 RepID=UPI001F281ECD|nr:DoxX family membrane protein [Dyadobacter sp. CY345]MCF2443528.1 DoxX family membrane protein [Dyadobacter sp. CY345]